MYTVAIYSRKSKLTEAGDSIQNQIDLCKNYANTHFNVSDFIIYEDEGYSGGNTNRPNFQLMLEDAKKKKFNVLICYRLDRISRNISDFSSTIEMLNKQGISFVSLKEQFDTSTPMGRAMMFIASVFAQLERETIAERVRDNMLVLARSGRWLGGQTPTGFKSEPIIYYDNDMNKKKMYKLSPIKEELDLVQNIYEKYVSFGTLTKLESWTLENHIKTKNNNNFDKSALKAILTNPVYAVADELLYEYFKEIGSDIASPKNEFNGRYSVITYNKQDKFKRDATTTNSTTRRKKSDWIIAVGKHQGVILSSDWIRVQNLLEKNSIKAPRLNTGSIGLITPLLLCKECGSKMRVSVYRRKAGTYYYYRCLMKENSKGSRCNVKNLLGSAADELVINEMKNISMKKSNLYNKLNHYKESLDHTYIANQNKKNSLEKELKFYEKAILNLTLQLSKTQNSTANKYIISQIEAFDRKINTVKTNLNAMVKNSEMNLLKKIDIDIHMQLLTDFSYFLNNLTFEEKKRCLKELIDKITWDGEKLEIYLLECKRKN